MEDWTGCGRRAGETWTSIGKPCAVTDKTVTTKDLTGEVYYFVNAEHLMKLVAI